MKKQYRVVEEMHESGTIIYEVQCSVFWWPFWLELGYYFTLEGALDQISKQKEKDMFKSKVIYVDYN